jgi:hypothetical protein
LLWNRRPNNRMSYANENKTERSCCGVGGGRSDCRRGDMFGRPNTHITVTKATVVVLHAFLVAEANWSELEGIAHSHARLRGASAKHTVPSIGGASDAFFRGTSRYLAMRSVFRRRSQRTGTSEK